MTDDGRSYEDEDVRAIIDRALRAKTGSGVTHDELVAIGAEVGLYRDTMETAAREVSEARLDTEATALVLSGRRRWLAAHAFAFTAVNGFLFAVNFLTTPGEWWVMFPLLGWGLLLMLHAALALSSGVSEGSLKRARRKLEERRRAPAAARRRIAAPVEPRTTSPTAAVDAVEPTEAEGTTTSTARRQGV